MDSKKRPSYGALESISDYEKEPLAATEKGYSPEIVINPLNVYTIDGERVVDMHPSYEEFPFQCLRMRWPVGSICFLR